VKKIGLVIILLAISSLCFAETIVFKSGQTVDTKIIEKTDKYVKVEVDGSGTVLSYPLEQIESIDGRKQESVSETNSATQGALVSSNNGLDKKFTKFNIFKIKLPQGWKVSQKFDGGTGLIIITGPNPQTVLGIRYIPNLPGYRNSSDIFKERIIKWHENDIREALKKQGVVTDKQLPNTKIIFQGISALRFDIELPEQNQRLSMVYFIKNGYDFAVNIGTNTSGSDYSGIINNSLNTLELLPVVHETRQQANQRNKIRYIIGIIVEILSTIVCYFLAKSKNMNPVIWAIFAFFLPLIIVIILLIMPKREVTP